MSLLNFISPALTAATQAAGANLEGKQEGSALLRQIYDQRQKQALEAAQTNHFNAETGKLLQPPTPKRTYDAARGVTVDEENSIATPVKGLPEMPIKAKYTPKSYMENGEPVEGLVDEGGNFLHADQTPARGRITPYVAPVEPNNVFQSGIGSDGKPTIFAGKSKGAPNLTDTGINKPVSAASGALAAPVAFRVGQAGEMLKKAADILPMLDQLRVGLAQSSAADIANNGVGIAGMHIPGTKGVGNLMMNNDPRFATYQAALGPLSIAAAHANAGLRVSDAQMAKIQKNMEVAPGDVANPTVMAMKKKNMVDLINSIVGSLPPEAVAAQEAQMDPAALAMLKAAGYRGAQRAVAPLPPNKVIQPPRGTVQPQQGAAPIGNVNLGAPMTVSPLRQKYNAAVAHLKATGRESEIPQLPLPPEDEE